MMRQGQQGARIATRRATRAPDAPALKIRAIACAARALTASVILTAALASPLAALEPLSAEKYINDLLIAARIADRIRRECPTIDGRLFYAYQQARALQRYALGKGYSKAQVDAFLDSKADKQRIYAAAEDYMARNGVTKGDAQSFCRLGRAEIAARTVTGSLLVSK